MTTAEVGPYRMRFIGDKGVSVDIPAYDALDDMVKVKSIQKKFRDRGRDQLLTNGTLSPVVATIAKSAGVLTIASGVTAGGFAEMLSKEPSRFRFARWSHCNRERRVKQTTIISSKPSRSIRLLAFPMASTACSSIWRSCQRDCHQHAVLRAERRSCSARVGSFSNSDDGDLLHH